MGKISTIKKLPDAEFEIMRVIWQYQPPITTNQIIAALGDARQWKPQTVLTLLTRLAERGFIHSEKKGKERTYSPIVEEQEYLQAETESFMHKYHQNSLLGFVKTLYHGKSLSPDEISELKKLLDEGR